MRIVSAQNTQRLDLAFRKGGMILLGFHGAGAEQHRALIWQITDIIYRDKNCDTRYREASILLEEAIEACKQTIEQNPDLKLQMICRLFDFMLLGNENNWNQCSLLRSRSVAQDEQSVRTDLSNRCNEMKGVFTIIENAASFLPEEFAAEYHFLLAMAKMIADWTLFTAHQKYNLLSQDYVVTDNALAFRTEEKILQERDYMLGLLQNCTLQEFVFLHPTRIERVSFKNYFTQQIHFHINDYLTIRPLQDVWEAVNGQVVFSDRRVLQHYYDMYSDIHNKRIPKKQIENKLKTLIERLQSCLQMPETNPQEILNKFDWVRLMYHLKYELHCTYESTLGTSANELNETLKKEIEFLHQTSIQLLQAYVNNPPDKIVDGSLAVVAVAELTELLKLQVDTLNLADRLRFGTEISNWKDLNLHEIEKQKDRTHRKLLTQMKHFHNLTIYHHSWSPNEMTQKKAVNPYYKEVAQQIVERYTAMKQVLLNAPVLVKETQTIALLTKKLRLLQRTNGTIQEAKILFEQIEGLVQKCVRSKNSSMLIKAEARYFYVLANTIYNGLGILRHMGVPSKNKMEIFFKEINLALQALNIVVIDTLSREEQLILSLYKIEVDGFRVNAMIDLDMDNIGEHYFNVANTFYQLTDSEPLAPLSNPELFKTQLEHAKLGEGISELIKYHHEHVYRVVLLPLFSQVMIAIEKKCELNYSEHEINLARNQAAKDWRFHLNSTDPVTSLFAHALYFEKMGSTLAATQFLYALQQVTEYQKAGSHLQRETNKLFPLQLSAFERIRHYHFWRSKPLTNPVWVMDDETPLHFVKRRLDVMHSAYCGCSGCDSRLAFEFKDESTRDEVLEIAQSSRFS